jgi:DNA-binding NarL/FixJ family response regulator
MTIQVIVQVDSSTEDGRQIAQRIAAGEGVQVVLQVTSPRPPVIGPDQPLPDEVRPLLEGLKGRGLSERLALVVVMDAQGCLRREIAEAFQMSERTVDWYWGKIYEALNVEKRAEVRDIVRQIQEELPPDGQALAVGEAPDDGV